MKSGETGIERKRESVNEKEEREMITCSDDITTLIFKWTEVRLAVHAMLRHKTFRGFDCVI